VIASNGASLCLVKDCCEKPRGCCRDAALKMPFLHRLRPTPWGCALALLLLLLLARPVCAAWQEISDYEDCGSTNFQTQKILVNFNEDSYWLNMSLVGEFTRQVVDSNPQTNRESSPLPFSD
jgi:hypothetical protein